MRNGNKIQQMIAIAVNKPADIARESNEIQKHPSVTSVVEWVGRWYENTALNNLNGQAPVTRFVRTDEPI